MVSIPSQARESTRLREPYHHSFKINPAVPHLFAWGTEILKASSFVVQSMVQQLVDKAMKILPKIIELVHEFFPINKRKYAIWLFLQLSSKKEDNIERERSSSCLRGKGTRRERMSGC